MTLIELINHLKKLPTDKVVKNGFGEAMSWRGSYYELAFEPKENAKVSDMLRIAQDANGKTFDGYKGGEFTMSLISEVYIAPYGGVGEPINSANIELWKM